MIVAARVLVSVALLSLLAAGSVAVAQDKKGSARPDAARGKQIASGVCAACHGADGNSVIAANPKLAAQHPEYLVKQLNDYVVQAGAKKAARENAVMAGFAAVLSAQDKRDVSAWFASQKKSPGAARNKATLETGQRIYRAGIAEKGVPACAGCHTPNGAGVPSIYPRLAGQHAEYTEATLKAMREGSRANNLAMSQISARLTDAEIAAVADFIAGLR